MSDYELYHYGVLGMKWGIRRANKQGTTYTYKSHSTKKYERKIAKAEKKGDVSKLAKYNQRLKRSKEFDSKEQKIAENMSVGKVLATRYLTMGVGAKNYQRHRALGESKSKAMLKTMVLPYSDLIGKAKYIRQDE